jgi:hypothetical protein
MDNELYRVALTLTQYVQFSAKVSELLYIIYVFALDDVRKT